MCAFNPVFAQGMTVAAQGVFLLQWALQEQLKHSPNTLKGLADRHRKAMPKAIKLPFFLATVLDLKYPQAAGKRPVAHRLIAWYVTRLMEASSSNQFIFHEFNKVLHLK